jgi:CheY-like chemotaxis protein
VPRILVVDDHPHYLAILRQMLEVCIPRARVTTAGDGSSALRLFGQQRFDLILVDYQLQTLSGSDIIRQIRARASADGIPLPPVVLMSSQPDAAVFARTLGVAAFLPKPILSDDIEATIAPLLSRRGTEPLGSGRLWRIQQR